MKRSSPARAFPSEVVSPTSFTLTAALIVGLLVLSTVFFSYRAQDVGQLPLLASAFLASCGRGAVVGWPVLGGNVASVLIAALIVFSWFGLGTLVTRLLQPETESYALRVSWQMAIGASLWSLLWFVLGTAGLYRTWVAVVLLLVGLALGVVASREALQEKAWVSREKEEANWMTRIAMVVLALPLLLGIIAALAPPTGKDALVYRLAVPKAYLAAGGIVDVTTNVYGFLSFGAEMNGVWGMLLGGLFNAHIAEAAFGAIAFAYWPLLLLATYGLARDWRLSHVWSFVAATLIATIPSFYQVATSGYVDHALALYVLLAAHGAGKWWATGERSSWLCLAFALGGALAIKFIALFAFFSLFIVVLFKARSVQEPNLSEAPSRNAILRSGFAAFVLAVLLASPWYIRTWVRTGSPLYPFYAHLWPGSSSNWDADRSRLFQMWVSRYGGEEKTTVDYLATPLKLSLQAQPELAAQYDGVLGIAFLLGLPMLLWGLWRLRLIAEARIAVVVVGGWYLCWLFTSEQLRFLLPAFPLLAVALVAVTANLAAAPKVLQGIFLGSALPGLLVIVAWFLEQRPLIAVLGGEARTAYLTRRLEHYPYYQLINQELPPTARVWLINMRNDSVHLERDYWADYVFEDYTITKLVRQAGSLNELRTRVKELGVTHLLLRYDVLLDYRRTPIVDERKPEAENQAKLQLLQSFLTEGAKVLKRDAKFMLVQL